MYTMSMAKKHFCAYALGKIVYKQGISHHGANHVPISECLFARTGWQQPVQVNIDTLRGLHLHHNCAIPFENIDVVLPREIHLDDGCLVDKLVTARRGILLRAKRPV